MNQSICSKDIIMTHTSSGINNTKYYYYLILRSSYYVLVVVFMHALGWLQPRNSRSKSSHNGRSKSIQDQDTCIYMHPYTYVHLVDGYAELDTFSAAAGLTDQLACGIPLVLLPTSILTFSERSAIGPRYVSSSVRKLKLGCT